MRHSSSPTLPLPRLLPLPPLPPLPPLLRSWTPLEFTTLAVALGMCTLLHGELSLSDTGMDDDGAKYDAPRPFEPVV